MHRGVLYEVSYFVFYDVYEYERERSIFLNKNFTHTYDKKTLNRDIYTSYDVRSIYILISIFKHIPINISRFKHIHILKYNISPPISFLYVHLHKLPINGIDNFANICILFPAVVKFVSLHGVDVHTVFFAPSGSFAIV